MKNRLLILFLMMTQTVFAQNDPVLSIDGVNTSFKSGLSFPYWLKSGQTVNPGSNVKSVSALEFTIDNENLKFSQVLNITNLQTVPVGKAWKIESLGFGASGQSIGGFSNASAPSIFTSPKTFNTAGTFDWIVPPGVTNICIEVWGAGGSYYNSYYGGGGAYGYECFAVIPGVHYSVVVGRYQYNQNGESSSVGSLIIANGGSAANNYSGGIGGTSTAQYNIIGGNGGYGSGGLAGNNNGWGYGNMNTSGQVIIYW